MSRTYTYLLRERLAREYGPACYLRPGGDARSLRFGPCDSGPPGERQGVQAHHLIPQQVLKRLHDLGHFDEVPIGILLGDWRDCILVCPGHHHRLDMHSLRPKLLDLPPPFLAFLEQFDLWGEAERIFVRPPGHSPAHGRGTSTSRYGYA